MKISAIETKIVRKQRRKVFKIAFSASSYSEGVYVKLSTDSGVFGLGEAQPFAPVTGDTVGSILATIELLKDGLIGLDPFDIGRIHEVMDGIIIGNTSAKAAIDIACYDIMGKEKGLPVHRLLGATRAQLTTDMTIGIDSPENMARDAVKYVQSGFHILKVKCGINPDEDMVALRTIREAVGDEIDIRVDVNQGYAPETALDSLRRMAEFNISEVEQPLKDWNIDGMAELRAESPIPIMMDESIHTPEQALIACRHKACDIVNIKLMKCGGIYPALQIADIAKSFGKNCLVGCMSESKLSIAAAAAVAVSRDNIHDVDLDSFMSFSQTDDLVSGGFQIEGDTITLSEKPGFGFDPYVF